MADSFKLFKLRLYNHKNIFVKINFIVIFKILKPYHLPELINLNLKSIVN